ncbi:Ferric-pseudobactin BN7/BN8 receptor [Achromobacter insuavis]|jgi:TonB-dependent siderophore receptor|uniref:Ferric-pseudobactin BN7/BN8 receptor n=3 Tax=Achromobacter TaxID=222 RepID=A0A6J5A0P1_9BURK|nr:Ferric-pseudobactin BN7/BN8 receptor [Achromobacter insuavis]
MRSCRPAAALPPLRLPLRRVLLASFLATACALPAIGHAQPRAAIPGPAVFSIPAGPLSAALDRFANAADLSLSYDPALIRDKHSPGLSGAYTVDAAFAELLRGTGLTATALGQAGYVLRTTAAAKDGVSGAATLRPVQVEGIPPEEGYAASTSTLATGTDTPIKQIPQSIHILTRQIIEDQQPQTLFDLLRNVPGVSNNPQFYGFDNDAYDMRGYGSRLLLDGIAPQFGFRIPAIGVERVEVLKGIDSAAMGDITHGGVVNVMLKRPQAESVREIRAEAGSRGRAGVSMDVAGTAPDNTRLQYRLILSTTRADGNTAGYRGLRETYLAPSAAWDDGTTRIELGLQYSQGRLPTSPFTVTVNGRPATLSGPIANADDHTNYEQTRPYFALRQQLNDNWSFNGSASVTRQRHTEYAYRLGPANPQGGAYYLPFREDSSQRNTVVDGHLQGRFDTGRATHDVTTGLSYYASSVDTTIASGDLFPGNVFSPRVPFPSSDITPNIERLSNSPLRSSRAYAQDFMTLDKRWHVMAGIALNQLPQEGGPTERAWTPKLGLSFDVSDTMSLYGAYSRGFSTYQPAAQGTASVRPIRSKTLEAGMKFDWPDRPLNASIALFQTSLDHYLEPIPDSPLYRQVDSGRSRGLELSLQGQLTAAWQTVASYTYTDFRPAANQVNPIPRHMASLWAKYTFLDPAWSGWGLGAGVYVQSGYAGDGQGFGDFRIAGQARTDVSLFYRRDRFSATLGVRNLFDRTLYAGHAVATRIYLDPGRTVLLTTAYRF